MVSSKNSASDEIELRPRSFRWANGSALRRAVRADKDVCIGHSAPIPDGDAPSTHQTAPSSLVVSLFALQGAQMCLERGCALRIGESNTTQSARRERCYSYRHKGSLPVPILWRAYRLHE